MQDFAYSERGKTRPWVSRKRPVEWAHVVHTAVRAQISPRPKAVLVGFRSDSWITNGSRKPSPHGVITSQHRQRPGTKERLLKSIGP